MLISIPFISLVMHLRIFPLELMGPHVWRQTQTQTNVLNFAREDMNILNPRVNNNADTDRIQRMEFPLMQWLFAWPYKWWGNHIIFSRMLTFLLGLFSVWGMYRLLFFLFNNRLTAALGAWAFNFSPLFYYYTLNPLPDNMALCTGIWGIAFFLHFIRDGKTKQLLFSSIFFGISVAVKLPFIIFMAFPAWFLIHRLITGGNKIKTFLTGLVLLSGIVPAAAWYAWVIPQWKATPVIAGIAESQKSTIELLDILQTHLVSNLPELYVNYISFIFFLAGLVIIFRKRNFANPVFQSLAGWGIMTIVYFLFEMNAIGKEHDYYMLPFLPVLFILVTAGIQYAINSTKKTVQYVAAILVLLLPLTAFLRADSRWNPGNPSVNIDLYQNKDELRKLVPDDAICVVGNDLSQHIFLYYIDKKGFVFDQDLLDGPMLKNFIERGAVYLYSDSRSDEREDVQPYLEEQIFNSGSLSVYKLNTTPQDLLK